MPSSSDAPALPRRPQFIDRATILAVVVVVVVSMVSALAPRGDGYRAAVVIAAGGAYLVSATVGVGRAERRAASAPLTARLAAQLFVGAAAVWASRGAAELILMPAISMTVLYHRLRIAVLATALLTAWLVFVTTDLWRGVPSLLVRGVAGFLASSAFVIVFSKLALRERIARESVERLAAEVERANARLREYASQIEELATVKERNRIAREIHDSLGHYLTIVNVQIEAARSLLPADDAAPALECLAHAQVLTREGLQELRRSVAVLRAPLGDALATMVNDCRASGLQASLELVGAPRAFSPRLQFALYRATQEALTNVRRHAKASRVDVRLTFGTEEVRLLVEDDGVGTTGPPADAGFGLLGIRERVELLGGRVSIRTAPGEGFAVDLWAPE